MKLKIYNQKIGFSDYIQDILLVEGHLNGKDIYLVANH